MELSKALQEKIEMEAIKHCVCGTEDCVHKQSFRKGAKSVLSNPQSYGLGSAGAWIRALDRLPDDRHYRFVRIEGTMSIAAYRKEQDTWMNESGDWFPSDQITWLDELTTPPPVSSIDVAAIREVFSEIEANILAMIGAEAGVSWNGNDPSAALNRCKNYAMKINWYVDKLRPLLK